MAVGDKVVLAEFWTEISDEINAKVQITNIVSDNINFKLLINFYYLFLFFI